MEVFVVDLVGYDAGGGNASVFSTLERAQASMPGTRWGRGEIRQGRFEPTDDGWWWQLPVVGGDTFVIYELELDED